MMKRRPFLDEPGGLVWFGLFLLWLATGTENLRILCVLGAAGTFIMFMSIPRVSGWVKRFFAR